MSLIVYKSSNKKATEEALKKLSHFGSDSIGLSYAKNKQLFIKKNIKFDTLIQTIENIQDCPCLIHFAEKPKINDKYYCGPYRLDENHVIAHIGDVWKDDKVTKPGFSQSLNFLILLKEIWNPVYFKQDFLKFMIEKCLPATNKIVIMNNLGDIQSFNDYNHTYKDLWISTYISAPFQPNNQTENKKSGYQYPIEQKSESNSLTYGIICNICKDRQYNKLLINHYPEKGWICHKCEPYIDSGQNKILPFVQMQNSVIDKKESKTLLREIELPQKLKQFVDVFQVI